MTINQCIICKNNLINYYCEKCEYESFHFTKYIEERFDCNVYLQFLEYVHNRTNLSKITIDYLFLSRRFDLITQTVTYLYSYENLPSIHFKKLSIPYEKHIDLFFSEFTLYNPSFKLILQSSKGYLDLKNYLSNVNSKLNILLYTSNKTGVRCVTILIKFSEQDLIPYPIHLLNEQEKNDLEKNISFQINNYFPKDKPHNFRKRQIEDDLFFQYTFIPEQLENHEYLFEKLQSVINECYSFTETILQEHVNNNIPFFERALLDIQMQSF